MATETRVRRGFGDVPCIRCGEVEDMSIVLENMRFRCLHCEEEWFAEDVVALIERWRPVLAWVNLAPVLDQTPKE